MKIKIVESFEKEKKVKTKYTEALNRLIAEDEAMHMGRVRETCTARTARVNTNYFRTPNRLTNTVRPTLIRDANGNII